MRNAARYPEPSPFILASGTGYTMEAEPGRDTLVLMPAAAAMLSTGGDGDHGGCGRSVTLST